MRSPARRRTSTYMPRKRPAEATAPGAEALGSVARGLRYTDTPGVYLNAANIPVDADGLLLGFKDVKRLDSAHWDEALSGPQLTPAAFLAAVAANPRLPLSIRIDAAKSAAPYTDRKKPLALDGGTGTDGAPLPLLSIDKLKGLPTGELKTLLALLSKAGVSV